MSKTYRTRLVALWRVVSIGTIFVITALVAAEPPIDSHGSRTELSPEAVLQTLGPGPLLSHRTPVTGSANRVKSTDIEDAIDQCVERNMASLNAPGAAVAVILDGELLYESGYGIKRRGGSSPVDADTIFRIGSVTKMMTAAAVMQQVELGRVDLEAPVTDYIPEFEIGGRWPADRISVWNTLTHSTTFPDMVDPIFPSGPQGLSVWAESQGDVELHAPPGSFWNYSNPNFMIAGLVAERASGTPYRQLFKESLWEPAGMNSTTFSPAEVVATGNYSNGHHYDYVERREYIVGPHDNDLWGAGPAGFAFSTVGDLVRWALLLMDGGGPVLSPRSASKMQRRHQWTHYTPDLFYGFGIMIEEYEGLDVRQHGGNIAGYGTYLLWVPERRFAVASLANVTNSLDTAAYCIVDEVLDPAYVEEPDLTTDPATWTKYTGDYVVTDVEGATTSARIYLNGNRLMGAIEDPASGATIYSRFEQLYLDTFLYDSDGNGIVDNDLTFCSAQGNPGFMMWMRNRMGVGERQLTPRAAGRTVSP